MTEKTEQTMDLSIQKKIQWTYLNQEGGERQIRSKMRKMDSGRRKQTKHRGSEQGPFRKKYEEIVF